MWGNKAPESDDPKKDPKECPDCMVEAREDDVFENHRVSLADKETDPDPALIYRDDKDFLSALKKANLTTYTYGCPLVGDANFKKVRCTSFSPTLSLLSLPRSILYTSYTPSQPSAGRTVFLMHSFSTVISSCTVSL